MAPPEPAPDSRTALLDATRARRLAREARLRERDSRDALARARATLDVPADCPATDGPRPPPPALPPRPDRAVTSGPQPAPAWERRALVSTPPLPPVVAREAPTAPLPSLVERALGAELREARATLAIARETAQLQREEIARLRERLTTATSAVLAPAQTAASEEERLRLAQRIEALEAERGEHARERERLRESLARHERERSEHARQLDALNDRLEVQSQALEQARRELEQERRRHTDAQALLARLRTALRGLDGLSFDPGSEPCDDGAPSSMPPPPPTDPTAPPLATSRLECATPASNAAARPPADASASPGGAASPDASPFAVSAPKGRSAIFDHWREGQIRRHFGAFGIDGTADLVRDPLARRASTTDRALTILLLGPGARVAARPLAESLLRGTPSPFVLHCADPCASTIERAREDDPLDAILKAVEFPTSPTALAALVRRLEPAVIVSRDCLTGRSEPAEWLDALETATPRKACLVFLEETGQARAALAPELLAIGERIWELLPERYTRDPVRGRAVASFREAYAPCPASPTGSLLAAIRARFELELFAQFGLLAEAFVAGPVADCFDPTSARDRRFLEQIAELDDRRVEAGAGPALHLVARIDPLAHA
ncbi:MAG: hypothetical protein R3F35_24360 [Myxococcota bacterium]